MSIITNSTHGTYLSAPPHIYYATIFSLNFAIIIKSHAVYSRVQ